MAACKVLVLGSGKVGKSVAELLLLRGGGAYEVTAADRNAENLRESESNISRLLETSKGASKNAKHAFRTMQLDASDSRAVRAALQDHDAVICMLPYDLVRGIAGEANNAGCHYFDVTEDVRATNAVKALANKGKKPRVALVPQCGLAPGYIAIAANDVARSFDTVHSLTLRVGALPMFPTNRLKYNVTWSVAGVVNEYCEPCNAMLDGEMTKVPALEGLEHFSLRGVEYEAFYTSGGVGTLIETLEKDKRLAPRANVAYKTIRYPGHRDLMKFLLEDLRFATPPAKDRREGDVDRRMLMDIMDKSLPRTLQDVVVIFINALGMKDGRFMQVNFEKIVPAMTLAGRVWPAIELTTAAGVCAMVDLHRTGGLPRKTGFIRQEEVSLEAFHATPFGGAYADAEAFAKARAKA